MRRRQQGANVSFQHQLWVTEEKEDGSTETTLMERTLSARVLHAAARTRTSTLAYMCSNPLVGPEYFILLKQADPDRSTVSKTLTCFTWNRAQAAATQQHCHPTTHHPSPSLSGTYWELNSFRGASHVAILEVEAESMESRVSMPDFVQIEREREVTEESSYDSYPAGREVCEAERTSVKDDDDDDNDKAYSSPTASRKSRSGSTPCTNTLTLPCVANNTPCVFEPSLAWTGEALLNERKITEVLKTVEREATSKNLKAAAQAVQFARSISTPVAGGQGGANGNGANGGGLAVSWWRAVREEGRAVVEHQPAVVVVFKVNGSLREKRR